MQKEKSAKNRAQDSIFKCKQCEKYFFHKIHLSLHERGHLNQLSNVINNSSIKSPKITKIVQKLPSTTEEQDNESINETKEKNEPRKKKLTSDVYKSKTDDSLNSLNRTNLNKSPTKKVIMKTEAIAVEARKKFFLCNVCGLSFNQIVPFKEHEKKHKYANRKKDTSSEVKSTIYIKRSAYKKIRPKPKFCKLLRDKNLKNLKEKLKKKFALKKNLRKIHLMKKQTNRKPSQPNEQIKSIDSPKKQNIKNNHNCSQCEKTFFHLQHLRLHEKNHMNMNKNLKIIAGDKQKDIKKTAPVNRCDFNSPKSDDNKQYECSKCDKSFFHLNHLRIHERVHKKPNIVDSKKDAIHFNIVEEQSSRNQLSLSISISTSANIESTVLDLTDETHSENIKELNGNEKYSEKSYQCRKCNKTFFHELHLKMHQRSHAKIQPHEILKPHKCTKCMASFLELINLEKHVLQMHEKKSYVFSESLVNRFKQLYKCDECEKEFKAKSHLASHKRAHFKELPKEFNNIENETESSNNIFIVEEIYGNYDFKNEQAILYSDVCTENPQMRSLMNMPCDIAMDENNSSYEKAMVNEFLYKCKFCDLLFDNEPSVKDHISTEHEKNYLNSFQNANVPVKVENHLITGSNSSESYAQKLELDNFNEHNYHLIQISDLYFENNYNNNIESTLPQIISTDKIIPNSANSIEIKNFDDLIKIDQKKFRF